MDHAEAHRRLDALLARAGGSSPQLVGILVADDAGDLAVSMDSADDTDILMMGIRAKRRAGPVVVERDLVDVTPTLETLR